MDKMQYSDKEIKELIDGIFDGSITEYNIPESLYIATSDYLKKGLYSGFGGDLTKFEGKDLELLKELRENVYMFSAAKNYTELKEMGSFLINSDGERATMREFTKAAEQSFETFNDAWGRTEYNTAIHAAQMANKWNEIEKNKDLLPILVYSTIGDACDICAPLDGMTAKVDDPIWDSVASPNHFNCLCIMLQEEDTELTPESEKSETFDKVTAEMDDTFKYNPGKDKEIFSQSHPYFDVPKKDIELAKNNFNLPIPSVESEIGKQGFREAKTISEAEKWATDKNININFAENIKEAEKLNTYNNIKESSDLFESKFGKSFGSKINFNREYRDIDFVKEIKVISDKTADTPFAEYLRSESNYGKADSLFINLAKGNESGFDFAENIKELMNGKTPSYNITSLTDVITHEAGHNYYFGNSNKLIKEFRTYYETSDIWKDSVSIYGQENASEFFAESIVSLLRGENKEAVKIITKFFKL